MIHTKLLIRRLAYVPWLLAFGLVLGWAGEAQAQDEQGVVLSGTGEAREDLGATAEITVKAAVAADALNDIYVTLGLVGNTGLNSRFAIELPTLKIAKGAKEGTGIVKFTPISEPTADQNLVIQINGQAGTPQRLSAATRRLRWLTPTSQPRSSTSSLILLR